MGWGEPYQQTGYVKWDKPGKVVTAKYLRAEEKVGASGKPNMLHHIDVDGEATTFWGTTILNDLLEQVAPGTLIRIEYTSERAVPNGKIKEFTVRPWVEE